MGPLKIEEPDGERFELALDQFERGQFFVFLGCGLGIVDGALQMRVPSEWEPDSITRERATQELSRAARNLLRLRSESPRFAALTEGLPEQIILLDDYGTGGIELCELNQGVFEWRAGCPKRGPAV